jgi:hypothetical protein
MGEICIEVCAPAGDFRHFNPDMKKPFELMPKLTFDEYMELPGSMKGKWLFVQQAKMMEVLDGTDGKSITPLIDRNRSRRISAHEQVADLQPDLPQGDPLHPDIGAASRRFGDGPADVDPEEKGS